MNWKATIDLSKFDWDKDIYTEKECFKIGARTGDIIREFCHIPYNRRMFNENISEMEELADNFEGVISQEEYNEYMADLYDIGDYAKIWIKTRF